MGRAPARAESRTTPATTTNDALQRNPRRTRWFHASIYVATLVLTATGWWLLFGREGQPSWLARVAGAPDVVLHEYFGWALGAVAGLGAIVGARGALRFVLDSVTFDRGDARWLRHWPTAVFTGRFTPHRRHFDPGQRIANVIMVLCLFALIVSGFGLLATSGGPAFVWFLRVHKWATYVLTPVIVGHVIIGLGVFPGYRGVWRAMHLGGKVSEVTARRLWPEWTKGALNAEVPTGGTRSRRTD